MAAENARKWYYDNIEKAKNTRLIYYLKNKQKTIADVSRWNKDNPEKRKLTSKRYNDKNKEIMKIKRQEQKDILKQKKKNYYEKNKAILLAKQKIYKKTHKEIVNAYNASRRGKIRGAGGSFNKKDVDSLLIKQTGKCNYCDSTLFKYDIDHIIPVALGGSNLMNNLQLLCKSCNLRKG